MYNMFGIRLKNIRIARRLSQDELGELLGTSKQVISRYENGLRVPKITTVNEYARKLGVSLEYLIGDDSLTKTSEKSSSISYPIIGEVAAGFGSEAHEEETGEYEQIPVEWLRGYKPEEFFVLRVKGDSMYPDYKDGDRVLVLRKTSVDSGSIAVVLYDGEIATLKRVNYVYGEDWMELEPLNREYAPKRVENEDLERCRVLGEVRRLIRVVKD